MKLLFKNLNSVCRFVNNRYFVFVLIMTAVFIVISGCSRFEQQPDIGFNLEEFINESGLSGGLVVYAGCNDLIFPTSWDDGSPFLVQILVCDHDQLEGIRKAIRDQGLYGRVTAVEWSGNYLPYTDNKINLLIASSCCGDVCEDEVDRVLAPLGTAYVSRSGQLVEHKKHWPDDIDDWTHARYDSTGNASSVDYRVGPPTHTQWIASPRWNRGVKTSSMVSADGRLFYILDDSHFFSDTTSWSLLARDAFSGVLLWRYEFPSWRGSQMGKKVGPIQTDRQLVAGNGKVFVPLEDFAPVSILDASSGEILQTLEHTKAAEEILFSDGVLVVLVNPNTPSCVRRGLRESKTIVAYDIEAESVLWKHDVDLIMPTTLAADASQVVFHDGQCLASLDLRSGELRWRSVPTNQRVEFKHGLSADRPGAEESTIFVAPQFAPTLMIYDDVVAFAGGGQLNVVSCDDGSELWRGNYAFSNYAVPVDIFGLKGLIWGPDRDMNLWAPVDSSLNFDSYDPHTGERVSEIKGDYGFAFQHHRCHQMKAVSDSIIAARAGVEFLDTATGDVQSHHWVRGSCYYGVMPGNGLLYVPPHDCACHVRSKLSGFYAFKSEPGGRSFALAPEQRLVRGAAYGDFSANEIGSDDWSTYRYNASRSGRAGTSLDSANLDIAWQTDIGGDLTAAVVVGGRLFLACNDSHRLFALDSGNGQVIWQYSFNAGVDSPPTVYGNIVLIGSRDGWVYALRASDGALFWKYMAAPEDIWLVSEDRLESAWPVHGSVLVVNDRVYFCAGRSSYIDGGMHFYGLDIRTGEKIFHRLLDSRDPESGQTVDSEGVDGYLNDILSSDGERIFLRHQVFDLDGNSVDAAVTHLHGADGYLSDATTTRLLWTYAPMFTSRHQGAFFDRRLSRALFPSGRILVEDDEYIYGYGENHYAEPRTDIGGNWALFSSLKARDIPEGLTARQLRERANDGDGLIDFRWWRDVPVNVWAMVQSGNILFIAGPEDKQSLLSQAAFTGEVNSILLAISTTDGRTLFEKTLPGTPIWDGLVAANGRLFMTTRNGQLICLRTIDKS